MKKMDLGQAIKEYNKYGGHFFSNSTMRFWKSELESGLMNNEYFITSEPDHNGENRRFTIRRFCNDFKTIETVGEFRQYGSVGAAMSDIADFIKIQKQGE